MWFPSGAPSPLLELFGGDESGPQVAVSHTLGLPPRGVVLGHDLQDVAPLEGESCLLARCCLVFQWDVVKQGSHVHLEPKQKSYYTIFIVADWLRGTKPENQHLRK